MNRPIGLINMTAVVLLCLVALPTSGCMAYSMATPGHLARAGASGATENSGASSSSRPGRRTRRRAVIATIVGPLELAAGAGAGYLAYRMAGGSVTPGQHAPQDRFSGMASDIGKHLLGLLFLGVVAGGLGVSGLGDLLCGVGELVSGRSCLSSGPPAGRIGSTDPISQLRFDSPPASRVVMLPPR